MSAKITPVTQHVQAVLRELQASHPEAGFIVIGLDGEDEDTTLSIAFNIDPDSMRETLTAIAEQEGDEMVPVSPIRILN